jgi:hypothetical protein
MTYDYSAINDAGLMRGERIEALKAFIADGGLDGFPPCGRESNNHIHTIYSFSP